MTRYRSMDSLRAIAIILVVLAHAILSYGAPSYLAPLQLGGTGVDLFFVLSGWLLGGQLFKEGIRSSKIDVKRFWLRRWMRTLPAYFAILIFSILQRYITKEDVSFPWQYFIFIQNYWMPMEFFSISWSLCVEEQFYIFIALFLSMLIRSGKIYITISLVLILSFPFILRLSGLYDYPEETHVRFDGCVAGVLLAQVYHHYPTVWKKVSKLFPVLALISALIYLFFYINRYFPDWGIGDPEKLILAILFASWISLANLNNHWREAITFPGSNYIATRSYSLYLVHPEVLALEKRYFLDLPFAIYFSIALLLGLLCSELLYKLVEKPFMGAREKFKISRSSS